MLNKKDYEMGSKSNDDFTVAMVSKISGPLYFQVSKENGPLESY